MRQAATRVEDKEYELFLQTVSGDTRFLPCNRGILVNMDHVGIAIARSCGAKCIACVIIGRGFLADDGKERTQTDIHA